MATDRPEGEYVRGFANHSIYLEAREDRDVYVVYRTIPPTTPSLNYRYEQVGKPHPTYDSAWVALETLRRNKKVTSTAWDK